MSSWPPSSGRSLWRHCFAEGNGPAARRTGDRAVPHDFRAAQDRALRKACHFHAVIGRPAAAAGDPFVGDAPFALEVNNGEIGIITFGDAPLPRDAEDTRGAVA